MSFDLKHELTQTRAHLDRTAVLIGQGAEQLRQKKDFPAHCDALGENFQAVLAKVPPPAPTPPKMYEEVEIEDAALRPMATILRIFGRIFGRKVKPDVDGNVPVRVKVKHTVELPDPMFPGTPARDFEVELDVHQIAKEEVEYVTRRGKKRTGFRYLRQPAKMTYQIHVPAVPPDAPLTPEQQAYVDEVKRIAEEVRDIDTFIDSKGRAVTAMADKSKALTADTAALVTAVEILPSPPAVAAELQAAIDRIEVVMQGLPAKEQEVNALDGELKKLKAEALRVCPELKL
jgi:hypothetical protein